MREGERENGGEGRDARCGGVFEFVVFILFFFDGSAQGDAFFFGTFASSASTSSNESFATEEGCCFE